LDGYIALETHGQRILLGKRYDHFKGFLERNENEMGLDC